MDFRDRLRGIDTIELDPEPNDGGDGKTRYVRVRYTPAPPTDPEPIRQIRESQAWIAAALACLIGVCLAGGLTLLSIPQVAKVTGDDDTEQVAW